MLQRNFKLCDFPVHSVCFLQNFFFRSEQKFLSVLYHCAKFYKFLPSTFKDIFDRNINFAKFLRVTRSLNLYLREPGVLAQARAINGPGRARHETISSHLNVFFAWVWPNRCRWNGTRMWYENRKCYWLLLTLFGLGGDMVCNSSRF